MKKMKIWIPLIIIVVVIVGGTFILIHNINKKVDDLEEVSNNAYNMVENKIEDLSENTVTNESSDVTNNTVNKTNTSSSGTSSNTGNYTAGTTDKKQKAIELVKREWGEDDSVSFAFDYINENGEYVIAVKNKSSATVQCYFRVNLETETVELE